ncbi:MAG: HmuY family protein [Chitinophagales bacterium]|nr:HmuY family protein [Chitinophagales bacterium]
MRKSIFQYKWSVFLLMVFVAFTSSCFKKDDAIALPPPGSEEVFQISMGNNYEHQEYFDLETKDTLGSSFDIWDMAFESSASGWHIWINGGSQELIANTDTQHFAAVTDTANRNWKWDEASWNTDSTAIGDWRSDRFVYVLDRGPGKSGKDRFKKIIFQSVDEEHYEMQYANLDGSDEVIYDIFKKPQFTYLYFTFATGGKTLPIEPVSPKWDLLFTRYRYIFYTEHPALPYVVTGVLINPDIEVAVDSTANFDSINYPEVLKYTYSSERDIIGYTWKKYNFTTQAYTVKTYYNYIIRDLEGAYWKLHFIDFYNAEGKKGYPQFVFQRL